MDLNQAKLSKSEWETIEKPVSDSEKDVLKLIIKGFHEPNIKQNKTTTFLSYTKIEKSPEIDYYIFRNFFEKTMHDSINKYASGTPLSGLTAIRFLEGTAMKQLKSVDSMRIKNSEKTISNNKHIIFEYIMIDMLNSLLKHSKNRKQKYAYYLYTLIQIRKTSISDINIIVLKYIDKAIEWANSFTHTNEIITNAYSFIERNEHLMKYEDKQLYPHQKQLFRIVKNNDNSKLILYTAPTGTGKTLSPIGLSENKRIIFVCVARHIGLALAKSAISVEKKVAFAFGCHSANDIRLHYYSAVEYSINKKSGGIWKVDNSEGSNVQIMICDVQSYITAMHYMLSFNDKNDIVTYWDEPTITMDYEAHELHETIHQNWMNNKIPTVVLSCATLPSRDELQPVYEDFCKKFDGAELHAITSHDCKKSIPILNKDGFCELPHYLYESHSDMLRCINHCTQNRSLLRYFDLREIITFIEFVGESIEIEDNMEVENYFTTISDITMNSLKEYYLELLSNIDEKEWPYIYKYMNANRKNRFDMQQDNIKKMKSVEHAKPAAGQALQRTTSVFSGSNETKQRAVSGGGVLATTSDAYTFTDGPTIYLTDEIDKIGQFYIQQAKIAASVFEKIMQRITRNSTIVSQIQKLEHQIEAKESVVTDDNKVSAARESGRLSKESESWMNEVNKLRKEIKMVSLDPMYVPNTKPHQHIWSPHNDILENAFVSDIGEENAKQIMQMDVDDKYKVLMLLGIGTFKFHKNHNYMEIMKQLADEQKLFMIIASTDYIYGTNYQFCHGFIGKDLSEISQQKIYQSMGRIGRNNIQQDYTIRFRNDNMIRSLFTRPAVNIEAVNMCKLFQSNTEE